MKSFLSTIILLLATHTIASSNDVYLKTGLVYRNVTVDTTGTVVIIDLGYKKDAIAKNLILSNQWTFVDSDQPARLEKMTPRIAKFFGIMLPDSVSQGDQKKPDQEKSSLQASLNNSDALMISTVEHIDSSVSTIKGIMIFSLLISIGSVIAVIVAK